MIVALDMTSPIVDQAPGDVSIVLDLESDNEPITFEESFRLWINGIEVTDFTSVKGATWAISWDGTFIADQEVLVEFEAADNDETLKRRWVFNVTGTSLFSTEQYRWAAILDRMSEYMPEYTEARSKEASVFKQFVNPIALKIDEGRLRVNRQNADLSVSKANIEDPDWVYIYKLNSSENFEYSVHPDGTKEYEAPEVFGYMGYNKIAVEAIDLSEFWKKLPTRISLTEMTDKQIEITSSTPIGELGHFVSKRFLEPQELLLWVHSSNLIVEVGKSLRALRIKISGIQQHQMEKSETITIIKDGIFQVPGVWQEVHSIEVIDVPEGGTAQLKLMRMPPRAIRKEDPLFKIKEEIVFWELVETTNGSYLNRKISGAGYVIDLAKGEDNSYIENKFILLDTSGSPVYIEDFSVDLGSELLYGLNKDSLYLWDRRSPVQTGINRLNGAERDPEVTFHVVRNGRLAEYNSGNYITDYTIEVDRAKGVNLIKRWSWAVVTESGSRSYIDSNGVSGYEAHQWQYNSTPISSFGIPTRPFEVELRGLGGDVFELYLEFTDGTTQVAKQIVPKLGMNASAEYSIGHLFSTSKQARIHVRSDGLILIGTGKTIYEVTKQYDYYAPDYETGSLILREGYDAIEVILND